MASQNLNPLLDISTTISENALILSKYLAATGLPHSSVEGNGAVEIKLPSGDVPAQAARQAILEACQKMHDLALGPKEKLWWLGFAAHDLSTLHFIEHFKVAQAVPLDGEISFTELAKKITVDEDRTRRILRYAMTNQIFIENREGYVSHTPTSALLVTDETIHSWVSHNMAEVFPSTARLVDVIEKDRYRATEPTETAFNLAFNNSEPWFVWLSKRQDRENNFAKAMRAMITSETHSIQHLVRGYDWAQYAGQTIVDVGGSTGHISISLAKLFPDLRFVVQDLAVPISNGQASLPAELQDRVSFQVHDFFSPQPVEGAEVYFLRQVLHDWGDSYCAKIIRSLIPALKNGARVIINDFLLSNVGALSGLEEKSSRTMDMQMMTMLNSKERTVQDWQKLFTDVDERFHLLSSETPIGSALCIIVFMFSQ
ncbi:O-methyltransferase [Mariannaea sp. PMI_226]|nr:O-methyltransferase [Mariannaea sp. PMI_226]